jgi:hypothetical protein
MNYRTVYTRKERIFNQDSLRLRVHALTDFLRSNKIEVLNVAGPRESKEPRRSRVDSVGWGRGEWGPGNLKLVVSRYFRLVPVG